MNTEETSASIKALENIVQDTYQDIKDGIKQYFTFEGKQFALHYDPRMVPLYAAHRVALDVLFERMRKNSRNCEYYLQIKLLEENGHRSDMHCRNISGIPDLPTFAKLYSVI